MILLSANNAGMSLLTFFAIFFAAVGDARFAVALPTHREHSSDGFGSDWRIRVAGGPAPAGPWNAAPAFGPSRSRLRTVAAGKSRDPFADRCPSIHVFRREDRKSTRLNSSHVKIS